jgi:hypothetical protein
MSPQIGQVGSRSFFIKYGDFFTENLSIDDGNYKDSIEIKIVRWR